MNDVLIALIAIGGFLFGWFMTKLQLMPLPIRKWRQRANGGQGSDV